MMMDHLHRIKKISNFKWKSPSNPDIDNLVNAEIFECQIVGEWDVSNERAMTFSLRNHTDIDKLVRDL